MTAFHRPLAAAIAEKGVPLTADMVGRPLRRSWVNHSLIADRLRAHARTWIPVNEYRTRASADSTAKGIRTGRWSRNQESPYKAGEFEARTELTEFGVRVVARYVGRAVEEASS